MIKGIVKFKKAKQFLGEDEGKTKSYIRSKMSERFPGILSDIL